MSVQLIGKGGEWDLPEGVIILGRHSTVDISIDDIRLSRRHAEFTIHGDRVSVRDLGSINGILVNGERITGPEHLREGDLIVIGPVAVHLRIAAGEAPHHELSARYHRHTSEMEFKPQTDQQRRTLGMDPEELSALAPMRLDRAVGEISDARATDPALPSLQPEHLGFAAKPAGDDGSTSKGKVATDQLLPDQSTKVKTDVLLPKDPDEALRAEMRSIRARRLLAGCADGFTGGLLSLLLALPLALGGLVLALSLTGAGLDETGQVQLHSAKTAASSLQLTGALLPPQNWSRLPTLLADLHQHDRSRFIVFFVGATAAVLALVLCSLFYFVATSMLAGGPFWHRRLGLAIKEIDTGYYPTALRALLRWFFILPLWPLAVLCCLLGRRSPHDLLLGCCVCRSHFTAGFLAS